jgi:hypothetical protein
MAPGGAGVYGAMGTSNICTTFNDPEDSLNAIQDDHCFSSLEKASIVP